MKFSILISSYNKGKYIERCINSCLNQKEKDFEVILFDNYSIDNTPKILKKFKDKIKIYKRKKVSESAVLNQIDLIRHAFIKSKGQIICLLDADDYFSVNKLSILRKYFLKKNKVDTFFDLPVKKYNFKKIKFKNNKKIQKNIWPSIIPTSSISCRRVFFNKFLKNSFLKKYDNLEIDFRLNVYSRCLNKDYFICKEDITYYRQVNNGIMSNIKKFSKKWWAKRLEAHEYMEKLFFNHKIKYKNKFDFLLSKILSY
jgi:glycosyltransferase involved in cell wall biosynthesis